MRTRWPGPPPDRHRRAAWDLATPQADNTPATNEAIALIGDCKFNPRESDTFVTSNSSRSGARSTTSAEMVTNSKWCTIPATKLASLKAVATACESPTLSANCCHALEFDKTNTVVDSGAGDGFGNEDTPGTDRQPVAQETIVFGSTGNCKESIAKDEFYSPLPADGLDFHVCKRGEVQRPLLPIGRVCNAGCKVHFDKDRCVFTKDNRPLLTGCCDSRTRLCLLPHDHSHDDLAIWHQRYTVAAQSLARDDLGMHHSCSSVHHNLDVTLLLGLGLPP